MTVRVLIPPQVIVFLMQEFDKCCVHVSFKEPTSGTQYRNLLISINGRTSNCTYSLDVLDHTFSIEWGSVVFIRMRDQGGISEPIYEADFLALPENLSVWADDMEITLSNKPGKLHYEGV